ncbi:MFS transporter [Streptomyces sp. NRRL S-87]|uniref:MFS transporter n=1 Tax=Streptomyces sp. NRRL S-87 TaxID=1463920 RepID=UPI000A75D101|nr:MFS transporter [Streptomyces sp. NRRL S-87]
MSDETTTYGPRRTDAGGRTAVPGPADASRAGRPASAGGRRGGWPAVAAVALGSLALVLSELLPVGALPAVAADLGVSTGTAGLLVVVPGLAAAAAAPVLTVASRRFDRRPVLWTLAALTVVADGVCALAPNLAAVLAGRLLLGLALGGFWAVGAAAAGRLVPPAAVHRASSLVTAGISVGTVASLPLAALAARTGSAGSAGGAGWRVAFAAAGVLGLLALGAQLRFLPRLPAGSVAGVRALLDVPRRPAARAGLLATCLVFLGHFAAYTYIAPYLQRNAHLGAGAVAGLLLAYGVAGIAGNFLAGLTLALTVPGTVCGAAAALAAVAGALPLCAGSPVLVAVLVTVWGAAFGAVPLSLQTALAGAVPEAPESALAVFVTAVQLSLAAGSLLGGLVADGPGIPAAMAAGAALAGSAAVAAAVLLRARRVRGSAV